MDEKEKDRNETRESIELRSRPVRYLTVEEWRKLRDSIDNARDKLIIRLIYELGCRVGEFTELRVKDVDFETQTVYFLPQNTKTGQGRWAVLSKDLSNDLRAYLGPLLRAPERPLFASRQEKGVSVSRVQQIVKKYAERAGIQTVTGSTKPCPDRAGELRKRLLYKVTVHSLRHSHIVHRLAEGNPVNVVQQQVGHKNLATTQIYTRVDGQEIKRSYGEKSGY